MTSEAATQPQPAPLPERVQQVLDATAGADTTQEWILHGPTLKGDFWLYSPREPLPGEQIAPGSEPINLIAETMGLHDARLIAAAPTLRALLAETAAALAAAEAREAGLRAALDDHFNVFRGLLRGERYVPQYLRSLLASPHNRLREKDAADALTAALGGQS